MVLERVRKCPLVYPVLSALYIIYARCLYPMGTPWVKPQVGA